MRWTAIIVGVVVDLGGTNVVATCYALLTLMPMVFALAAEGLSQAELQARMQTEVQASMGTSPIMMVLGLLLSVAGGYVAGRMAKRSEVLHGFAVGAGVVLVSVATTLACRLPVNVSPLWLLALTLTLNIGSTTLGGYLAGLQRTRKVRKWAQPA